MREAFQRFQVELERAGCEFGQRNESESRSQCPSCQGRRRDKLSVREADDGALLVKCHGDCSIEAICKSLGLEVRDLFPEQVPQRPSRIAKSPSVHLTLDKAIAASLWGVRQSFPDASEAGKWIYHDSAGQPHSAVVRFEHSGGKTYRQCHSVEGGWVNKMPPKPLLYRLPDLATADEVWVVEGEKAADAVAEIGLHATTPLGGSGRVDSVDFGPLNGKSRVVLCPDSGGPGEKWLEACTARLAKLESPPNVEVCDLGFTEPNLDVVDWLPGQSAETDTELQAKLRALCSPHKLAAEPNGGSSRGMRSQYVSAAELVEKFPHESEPIIEGLLRRGETANIIASPKTGKSWLTLGLAISIAGGHDWLGHPTTAGRVLIVDNELKAATSASRLRTVSEAMGVSLAELGDRLSVENLRGRLTDIHAMRSYFASLAGKFDVIILDAMYRLLPSDMSENDNAAMTQVYNTLDKYAGQLNAAFVCVHHASKGEQSRKSVTDMGAGAGAQSRAADTHIVIRPHELAECAVLEAAVRSFPPRQPLTMQWKFPTWEAKPAIEAQVKLPKAQSAITQERNNKSADEKVLEVIGDGQVSLREIRKRTRFGSSRAESSLARLIADGLVSEYTDPDDKRRTRKYSLMEQQS